MARASFELDVSDLTDFLTHAHRAGPRVAARALNRSAVSTRAVMVKAVREDVGLKAKTVRDEIRIVEARPDRDPTARLAVSKKRIPLIEFKARQLKRAGVKTSLRGGSTAIPGAFIQTMRSGHRGVYKRATYPRGPRLPIIELKGPSLAKPFATHWRVGIARFRETIPKNVNSEIRFAIRKGKRR